MKILKWLSRGIYYAIDCVCEILWYRKLSYDAKYKYGSDSSAFYNCVRIIMGFESSMRLVSWGNKNAQKGASLDGQGTVSAAPQQQPL